MATLPAEGRWSIKSLADDDVAAALAFLRRDALINVYLISRLLEERSAAATQIYAVRHNRDITLLASLATNIVLASDPGAPSNVTETAVALVADRILTRMLPVRAIISPATLVEMLWTHLHSRIDPPAVVRLSQPIYAIRRRFDFADLTNARYATLRDLDALVPACAAMHKEEVGIDPLERDAIGYRERVRELIERKRSIIRLINEGNKGVIASKCEFSAVTNDVVQLMGVWTDPRFRRRGLAKETLREVAGHLFRKGKAVTLFVNDFNTGAIALYEGLGFRRIGVNRALIW
ncbi:MAG TPA: GNAT family N-acetyltransferase [Thermoanaerobaculia bacterium]|nr:GNAT family N-acetyltransferase [Thermoanaerobaculia bacterium]